MKARVQTIGGDEQYGEPRVIVDDDQIGELTIREMEFDSLDELVSLTRQVDTVEMKDSLWDKYDVELTLICQ